MAEERLKPQIEQLLAGGPMTEADMRAVSLTLCLLVATLVAMAVGSSHALPLIIGATLGVLGPRLWDKFRAMRAPDYDS